MADTIVPVTQADRERAWPFRPSQFMRLSYRAAWLSGVYDTQPAIQAFAAHRTRQPTQSNDCPKCDKLGDDCGERAPSWEELAAYWKAENAQLRHDLERQMDIANEHVNEAERLRRALTHIAFSGADGPYGEFGEALNEHQMRRVAKAALKEQSK